MKNVSWALASLVSGSASAQSAEYETQSDRDVELPGANGTGLAGDGGYDLQDADFVGNPLKQLTGR